MPLRVIFHFWPEAETSEAIFNLVNLEGTKYVHTYIERVKNKQKVIPQEKTRDEW